MGEAVGDAISKMVTTLGYCPNETKNSLPLIDTVVALLENSVTIKMGQEKKICIYMLGEVRF